MSAGNYVYRLFDIMEEFGDDTDIPFAPVFSNDGPVQWQYIRHQDVDGMGMFYRAMRAQGVELELPQYVGPVPGRWQRVKGAWRKFKTRTPAPVQWKIWQPSGDGRAVRHANPTRGLMLSEQQTRDVIARAKQHDVTLNSYLLWALNKVAAAALTRGDTERAWGNTINLRGFVPAASVSDNQSSIITVVFRDSDGPAQLHRQIRQLYDQGAHWGSWDFLSTICRFGPGLVRKQIRRYYGNNNSQMGTFSNLGVWNWKTPEGVAPCLFFAPPCTRAAPVAACAATTNGHMTLTLSLHQFLQQDEQQVDALVQRWSQTLLHG